MSEILALLQEELQISGRAGKTGIRKVWKDFGFIKR